MSKWLLGLLLGGFLGIFDGLTAPIAAPIAMKELPGIVIGSTFKGVIAGVLIGLFAQKVRSVPLGIVFGLMVSGLFAFAIFLLQYLGKGDNYFFQIMLPGAAVGVIVGYVTQRYGRQL